VQSITLTSLRSSRFIFKILFEDIFITAREKNGEEKKRRRERRKNKAPATGLNVN
jgi:hypothetical protein